MIARCENTRAVRFSRYGGRGIKIDPAWRASFATFFRDVGPRPSSRHSLDRIDRDGDYSPGNVRWATPEEQSRNRIRVRLLDVDGVPLGFAAAAHALAMHPGTLRNRFIALGLLKQAV
jgi:hypothetical protein